MFGKKCSKCNVKIKKDYDFCPSCGLNLKSRFNEKDYGLLGKNDEVRPREPDLFEGLGLGGFPIGKILKGAMKELPSMIKMIEKQMEESLKERNKPANSNNRMSVRLFVNGKKIEPQIQDKKENFENINKIQKTISKEKMKKLAKFPKIEPKSEVRRLSGRVIYNIQVPGVMDVEDVFINQLENSIEIKAIGVDKVYSKTLNLNLPLIGYDLVKGNLVLELGVE